MKDVLLWLDTYGFIYKGVLIIPSHWKLLYSSEWDDIDSTIKGML